jgi:hypothetical protein
VFDPGLGLIRAGFLFSRYGLRFSHDWGAIPQFRAKISGARNPAPNAQTYSGRMRRVKAKQAENRPERTDLAEKGRMASGE